MLIESPRGQCGRSAAAWATDVLRQVRAQQHNEDAMMDD